MLPSLACSARAACAGMAVTGTHRACLPKPATLLHSSRAEAAPGYVMHDELHTILGQAFHMLLQAFGLMPAICYLQQ